jgi:hypothetical protein
MTETPGRYDEGLSQPIPPAIAALSEEMQAALTGHPKGEIGEFAQHGSFILRDDISRSFEVDKGFDVHAVMDERHNFNAIDVNSVENVAPSNQETAVPLANFVTILAGRRVAEN